MLGVRRSSDPCWCSLIVAAEKDARRCDGGPRMMAGARLRRHRSRSRLAGPCSEHSAKSVRAAGLCPSDDRSKQGRCLTPAARPLRKELCLRCGDACAPTVAHALRRRVPDGDAAPLRLRLPLPFVCGARPEPRMHRHDASGSQFFKPERGPFSYGMTAGRFAEPSNAPSSCQVRRRSKGHISASGGPRFTSSRCKHDVFSA
jgi:hypothetical protein